MQNYTLKSRLFSLQPRANRTADDNIRISKVKVHLLLLSSVIKFNIVLTVQAGKMFEYSSGTSLRIDSPSRLAERCRAEGARLVVPRVNHLIFVTQLCFSLFNYIFRGIGSFPSENRHLERGNIFLGDM